MGTYHGPKVRLTRRVGAAVAETPKHTNVRRPKPPGMHGRRRGRQSLYGEQLMEKRKLTAYYDVRNQQFTRYIKQAQAASGSSVTAMQRILETRLDNVIRRLHWVRTIWQAHQIISHGHIYVNGQKVDRPSYPVQPGDRITVKPGSEPFVREAIASARDVASSVPQWLAADDENLAAGVVRLPEPEEIRLPFEIDFTKVIELYTR
jgi:small subunit ribosomal protein S4